MSSATLTRTHQARVYRDGRWWMIEVPGVGVTHARRVSEIEKMTRELVAVWFDVSVDDVSVELRYDKIGSAGDISAVLAQVADDRRQAALLEKRATTQLAETAKALAASDVPLRDIGALLGVSFQRAHQLVNA